MDNVIYLPPPFWLQDRFDLLEANIDLARQRLLPSHDRSNVIEIWRWLLEREIAEQCERLAQRRKQEAHHG